MNGHTPDDLEKLPEEMREERARVDEAGGEPFGFPPNGGAMDQKFADAGSIGHEGCVGDAASVAEKNNAASAANGTAQPHAERQPEPSKLIFGRNLRHPDPAKFVEVPEYLRVDPDKLRIDALLIERVSDVPAFAVEWL